ncbi:MAG: sigma-70 family RNA polymerase sigma factor [Planctomycetota bacterium]
MSSQPPERDPQDEKDRALIAQAQAGDREALGRLLERMQDRVFAVAYRMVGSREAAGDVTQDVFVQLIKGLDRYDGRARVGTWVYRIAMNVAISYLRREGRRRHRSLDAAQRYAENEDSRPTTLGAAIADESIKAGSHAVERQEADIRSAERIQDALNHLSDEHRAVLILRDATGLDYQQVADALDLPVGTVKSRLFRARIALREVLEAERVEREGRASDQSPDEVDHDRGGRGDADG